MTRHTSKAPKSPSPKATTSVNIIEDVDTALSDLLVGCAHRDIGKIQAALLCMKERQIVAEGSEKAHPILGCFHETLWGLRTEFDPSAVTMSSTNIPDAILKLSTVLTETSESSHKVFTLVDKHNDVLKQSERYLADFERESRESLPSKEAITTLIHRQRILNQAAHALSHEVVMSQEFQDLCGQRVKKVVKLLCDIECYLRALFDLLQIELPSTQRSAEQKEEDKDIDQASADILLKELGLS